MLDALTHGTFHWQPLSSAVIAVLFAYLAAGGFYRLYLSPIAKFPGNKLTALTYWYECYYDLIKGGRFSARVTRMHDEYGPIVRINPHELHIQDSQFYATLYRREGKQDKYARQVAMFGIDGAQLATVQHEAHRRLRAPLAPFFSKKSISGMTGLIHERLGVLCHRIHEFKVSRRPMPLGLAFVALTADIVSTYALIRRLHLVEREDFSVDHHHMLVNFNTSCHLLKHFPWFFRMMQKMPHRIASWLDPELALMFSLIDRFSADIQHVRDQLRTDSHDLVPSIYQALLESDLPNEVKSTDMLAKSGLQYIIAGSETTSQVLSTITYHLLANPDRLSKLRTQLQILMPDPDTIPPLPQLEANPYLTACVQEGLRLSYGTVNRLTRVCATPIKYREWDIPANTPVGMTTVDVHDDESIFPDHMSFLPERWLVDRESGDRLDNYLFTFGKGTRMCIGMNLAYAELYITLAVVFRRFEFELYQTDRATVQYGRDYFTPFPEKGSDGVMVLVK
ncbi:MAG: hypothetical protein Q9220_001196 [cf. Caloplaca sp. 1 TL-2023]